MYGPRRCQQSFADHRCCKWHEKKKQIINIYRSFNPYELSERDLFSNQLDIVKSAFNNDTVIIGDLNLDYNKRFDVNYSREN